MGGMREFDESKINRSLDGRFASKPGAETQPMSGELGADEPPAPPGLARDLGGGLDAAIEALPPAQRELLTSAVRAVADCRHGMRRVYEAERARRLAGLLESLDEDHDLNEYVRYRLADDEPSGEYGVPVTGRDVEDAYSFMVAATEAHYRAEQDQAEMLKREMYEAVERAARGGVRAEVLRPTLYAWTGGRDEVGPGWRDRVVDLVSKACSARIDEAVRHGNDRCDDLD